MKFTLNWLKEHLDTDATLSQICDRLTMLGLEVEGVEDRGKGLENFVIGEVLSAEKHPDADKLQVLNVSNGKDTVQVVCGAPNARKGLKGVFAADGMYVPGIDVTLKATQVRGVESFGMMLSEREMGLSDAHTGIIELADDVKAGANAIDVMGLGDPVIEIAITPNRGDCLGVRGVARDLAASGMGSLKPLTTDPVPGLFASPVDVSIDGEACTYFVGRYVRGVKNGESPKWLQDRLNAIGLRPISALVDITNLMTFEYGRPLHVFDADKVDGHISARLAKDGETLLGLDGKEYTLDSEMCVIADEAKAEAIAGVMGGEDSGCTETTINVFIESAVFDPIRTAATGRKLNVMTDARYRFERGIDDAFTADGMEIATRFVLDLCGGEPSSVIVAGSAPNKGADIAFRPARIKELTGVKISLDEVTRILTVLGFTIEGSGDSLTVTTPTWRNDIVGEACLVEEVVRVHGYEHIPMVPLPRLAHMPSQSRSPEQSRRVNARRTLAGRGMDEAVTYSFLSSAHADLFGGVPETLKLVNPISADLDAMRPSILPNLIAAIARNDARGITDGCLFEVGPQFSGHDKDDQASMASGVRSGQAMARTWTGPSRPVDVFDAKADAIAALEALGIPTANLQVFTDTPDWYHPGRSGRLCLNPKVTLATFGEVHPRVLKAMDAKGPMAAFEVFLDNLAPIKAKKSATRPLLKLSAFQPVERDFAFVVDRSVAAAKAVRAAQGADKKMITKVEVFDLYEGSNLGEDKKSLAISVTLQPTEQTLTDSDIEAVGQKIIAAVTKATGGVLRA